MKPSDPIGPNFEAIGFESSYSLLNFGSLIFVVCLQLSIPLVYLLLRPLLSF